MILGYHPSRLSQPATPNLAVSTSAPFANRHERPATHRANRDPAWARWALTAVALVSLAFFLVLPLLAVFAQAFAKGGAYFLAAIREPEALASIRLTLFTVAVAVPSNVVFGVAAAWAIAKFR